MEDKNYIYMSKSKIKGKVNTTSESVVVAERNGIPISLEVYTQY